VPLASTLRSPVIDLEMDHKWLFLDKKIVIEFIITGPLIVFPSESFDGVNIIPEG
jgi:hypothetical protein